jgi:hypothetical protein
MELNEFQYLYVIDSVKRFRLTVSEKYQVHSPDDENRILAVLDQLGINPELPNCKKCDGLYYSKVLLSKINQLVLNYETGFNNQ